MLLSLTNVPRDYSWGSTTLLAGFEGREPSAAPEAEVWFGDHPGDPSDVDGGGTLDAATEGTLPYLLKLLAADGPLSIQVHPTIEQARDGWAREAALAPDDRHRNYRDDNHKPELIVALSDTFEALSGLRPVNETRRMLDALGDAPAVLALRDRLDGSGDALRGTIGWILSEAEQEEIVEIIDAVRSAADARPGEWAAVLRAVVGVADVFPGDPGVIVALLMNHVVLRRGEGLFLRAGLLHAYLAGLGVEIMAASDNVLRGGLTPKHIDVPELLSVLDTTTEPVPVIRPAADGAITSYPVPVQDFALRRVTVAGEPIVIEVTGPAMVLSTAGDIAVSGADAVQHPVAIGAVVFASADERSLEISGTGEAFIATPGR